MKLCKMCGKIRESTQRAWCKRCALKRSRNRIETTKKERLIVYEADTPGRADLIKLYTERAANKLPLFEEM